MTHFRTVEKLVAVATHTHLIKAPERDDIFTIHRRRRRSFQTPCTNKGKSPEKLFLVGKSET